MAIEPLVRTANQSAGRVAIQNCSCDYGQKATASGIYVSGIYDYHTVVIIEGRCLACKRVRQITYYKPNVPSGDDADSIVCNECFDTIRKQDCAVLGFGDATMHNLTVKYTKYACPRCKNVITDHVFPTESEVLDNV